MPNYSRIAARERMRQIEADLERWCGEMDAGMCQEVWERYLRAMERHVVEMGLLEWAL